MKRVYTIPNSAISPKFTAEASPAGSNPVHAPVIRRLWRQDAGSLPNVFQGTRTHYTGLMHLPGDLRKTLVERGLPSDADDRATREWMTKKLPGLVKLLDFITVVYRESDRGCVICATAFIDDSLESAIRGFLDELGKQPAKLLDSLLKKQPLPPLGSFAVRIKMARALCLIDDKIMTALNAMRPMRNDAAHLSVDFSFEHPEYDIDALFAPLSKKEQTYLGALRMVQKESPDPSRFPSTRRVFEMASSSIFYRMVMIAERPSWGPPIHKAGGNFSTNFGPYDRYYDELMDQPLPDSGSSEDSTIAKT
jgi:hypothetical protein